MKFNHPQSNFRSGRLSPKIYGQVDIKEYFEGMSVAENGFVAKQGGFYKRYGSQPIAQFPEECNIITVTLFKSKSYHIVFFPDKFQVLDIQGHIMNESPSFTFLAGQELDTSLFSVCTMDNSVYVTHYSGLLIPLVIKFTSEVTALIDSIPRGMYNIPMNDANTDSTKAVRLNNVNSLGSLQIEANFNMFSANMIGEYIMVVGKTNYPSSLSTKQTDKKLVSDIFYISSYVSPTVVNVVPFTTVNLKAEPVGGGVAASQDFCVFANFNVDDELVSTSSLWQTEFYDQAWNVRYGWPRTCTVDEGRLIFGGTPTKPVTLYASKTNSPAFFLDKRFVALPNIEYNNTTYSGDSLETDPYQFTLATKYGSDITFMESSVSFIVGTGRQEFIVGGGGSAISKKNITVRPHTSHGTAPLLSATSDNTVFYVGKTRDQVFLFKYNEANGSYISKEISILNDDVFLNKVKRITWHEELGAVFIVLDTGQLVTITHTEETQTLALTTQNLPFEVLDVSYAIQDGDEYAVILGKKDGKIFLEYLDRKEIGYLPSTFDSIKDKILFADNLRIIPQLSTRYIKCLHGVEDIVNVDPSAFIIGQEVVFTSTNPSALVGTGLSLNTPYYAIPTVTATACGIRLATTPANALSNTYINITPELNSYFDIASFSLRMDSNRFSNTKINLSHVPEGETVTVYYDDGALQSVDIVKGVADEYDVAESGYYVVGTPFKMVGATMPLEAGQQYGTAQMGLKRVDNVAIRFTDSYSFKVSTDGYNEEEVVLDEKSSGRKDIAITANSEYDQRVFITNDKWEPCYINSLIMRGVTNDG